MKEMEERYVQQSDDPKVIVLRQREGIDIVGILAGAKTGSIGPSSYISTYLIEHPFVPIMDYDAGSYNLVPFCPLTAQTIFEFQSEDLIFAGPATDNLTTEYLTGLASIQKMSVMDSEKVRKDKEAFKLALEKYTLSPGTETLQ